MQGTPIAAPCAAAKLLRPRPSEWTMLLGGLGSVAHATRLGRDGRDFIYTLVEPGPAGSAVVEDFPAPDHATALERAREVTEGGLFELWFGDALVAREG